MAYHNDESSVPLPRRVGDLMGAAWRAPQAAVTRLAAILLMALSATGCGDLQRNVFDTHADAADISAWFYNYIFWITAVIMLIVGVVFTYAVIRFREKPDDDGTLPKQVHGHLKAEIGWTIAPAIIVIAIIIPTVQGIYTLDAAPAPEDAVHVQVTGKQFWWEYDYQVWNSASETFDLDFTTANELHVEVDRPVHLKITSADVIHAFWVPNLFGKRDAIPGRTYPIYFTPRTPGEYIGQCAELCGESHALMGIKIFVHPKEGPNSYNNWLEAQRKPAEEPTAPLAVRGKELFVEKGCIACHTIRGDDRTQINPAARGRTTGPDLTHVGSRSTIAALTLVNTRENLTRWIHRPGELKGSVIMAQPKFNPTKVTEEEAAAMATYLFRLK